MAAAVMVMAAAVMVAVVPVAAEMEVAEMVRVVAETGSEEVVKARAAEDYPARVHA